MNEKENQKKYQEFIMSEAKWLDEVVRELIPKWVQWFVEKNNKNILGRVSHFLVDYFFIPKFLGITITRNQDTEILEGKKGFRPEVAQGYKIIAVRTKVLRKNKLLAERRFPVGIHIKN